VFSGEITALAYAHTIALYYSSSVESLLSLFSLPIHVIADFFFSLGVVILCGNEDSVA
jgi:hypothetical protein